MPDTTENNALAPASAKLETEKSSWAFWFVVVGVILSLIGAAKLLHKWYSFLSKEEQEAVKKVLSGGFGMMFCAAFFTEEEEK